MNSEFPDPEEEYDLVHDDEYEILRQIEDLPQNKQFTPPDNARNQEETTKRKDENISVSQKTQESEKYDRIRKELNRFELNTPVPYNTEGSHDRYVNNSTKKRPYEELFGDIDDILEYDNFVEPRDKKPRWDQADQVIKLVLDARDKFHQQQTDQPLRRTCQQEWKRETISISVPCWNFVAVTRTYDSQRIYVRVKSDIQNISDSIRPISNLLSVPYSQLKSEAEEIIARNAERIDSTSPNEISAHKNKSHYELWVDKYKPKSYVELLSDESVNRHLLHWLKLWDKLVFNRNYVQNKKKKDLPKFKNWKFKNEKSEEEVDNNGFPIHRIVLLTGPPGLGKTTLAHLAAKHAGYNVVELNASDERNPDAFKQVLLASTQMKAVMGDDPRPNCVVLDEIDGAPAPSIELLLKFVQGKLKAKKRKEVSKEGESNTCLRPIICICNEPYTPSLRALRAVALIIPVPEVTPVRLADRLGEIARNENLNVSPDFLLKLAEISGCDVRSCLGTLQYLGKATSGINLSFALKDSRKGLFDSWKQILTIPSNRSGLMTISERVKIVLKTVYNGETEKLVQGIFHNYPEICGEKLRELTSPLDWFAFYDIITKLVASQQTWSLMSYTNYAFVVWHLYFSKTRNPKLSYPAILYEVNQKISKSHEILISMQRNCGRDRLIMAMDIAPFLSDLLTPRLRTVAVHLRTPKEQENIARLVNILLEYGLTFVQEKHVIGTYEYKLDP